MGRILQECVVRLSNSISNRINMMESRDMTDMIPVRSDDGSFGLW